MTLCSGQGLTAKRELPVAPKPAPYWNLNAWRGEQNGFGKAAYLLRLWFPHARRTAGTGAVPGSDGLRYEFQRIQLQARGPLTSNGPKWTSESLGLRNVQTSGALEGPGVYPHPKSLSILMDCIPIPVENIQFLMLSETELFSMERKKFC